MSKKITLKKEDLINSYFLYAAGYYESGMDLINLLLDEKRYAELPNPFRRETIELEEQCKLYPMLFLFRQYVELMIKALYLHFDIIEDDKELQNIFNNHSLKDIWEKLKNTLIKIDEEGTDEEDSFVYFLNPTVNYFILVDNDSYHFRYPTDKKLNFYFKKNQIYDLNKIYYMIKEFDENIHYYL